MKAITQGFLDSLIVQTAYHQFPGTTVTACCLTLRNGFNVVGTSACVNYSDFDIGIGQNIARQDAVDQMWKLAGYGRMELEFWKHQIAEFTDA